METPNERLRSLAWNIILRAAIAEMEEAKAAEKKTEDGEEESSES